MFLLKRFIKVIIKKKIGTLPHQLARQVVGTVSLYSLDISEHKIFAKNHPEIVSRLTSLNLK